MHTLGERMILRSHVRDAVEDCLQLVGRAPADDKLDEVPLAFWVSLVHRESLAAEVEAACAQHLADFKLPRAVYGVGTSRAPPSTR